MQAQFEIKDIGDLKFCLGIRIEHDEETGNVTLSQPAYIEELLEKVNLTSVRTKPTPFPPGLVLRKEDSPITEEGKADMTLEPYCQYRSLVGALLYLAGSSLPDISYAVNCLAM